MLDNFVVKIKKIFDIIVQPIDIMYKLVAINNCKLQLNIGKNESFGEYYTNIIENKKNKGAIYTPIEISNYIIKNTIHSEDIINNPFIKIVDPSCGCGNLIIPCFLYLKKIYEENIEKINKINNIKLKATDINKHIIQNNLFGFDIDKTALKILIIDLFVLGNYMKLENFSNSDFLLEENDNRFNIVIGNPPYVGLKAMDKDYSSIIKRRYKEIFKDKGDLSYCFFKAALNKLSKEGKLTFITSRYFLESSSGEELRKTLKEFCSIEKIVDFYGIRPFKNIGIDPVIIFLSLEKDKGNIKVIKPKCSNKKDFLNSLLQDNNQGLCSFDINKNFLNNKGWILRNDKERNVINKIEQKCFTNLGGICDSFQGIITGCDKAFVVDKKTIESESLEKDIIKPWIKSSHIKQNKVNLSDMYLIYSDLILEENSYPNSINHIIKFKEKLMKRRECKNGVRKWYNLQWGRNLNIFEGEKIVFPFKSSENRFSLDKGSYFSADVYCLVLKEGVPFTYEYLLNILNSKVYEYYFKTFAKKLGDSLYEYYPNNLMKLCIPTMLKFNKDINICLYEYFGLNSLEIDIIESYTLNIDKQDHH